MATSTLTRPARKTPARKTPAPAEVPEVLKGVTAPVPVRPTRKSATLADVAKAVASEKAAKAPKAPKVNVNEIKNDLAALIVRAAGDAIESLGAEDPIRALGTTEAIATLASRWLHYLPVGASWPEGILPVPPRSEWNADGTRV